MTALVRYEVWLAARRMSWPAALVLHASATALFVATWGPTGGLSLWQASLLHQLTAVDRLASAVLFTWFSTYVLSDGEAGAHRAADWSAVTGRSVASVFRARVAAIAVMAIVFIAVAAPPFVSAGETAAASTGVIASQLGAALGFALLCAGVTAVTSVALRDRVAVWCTAMATCLIAAVGVRLLGSTLVGAAAPAAVGVILLMTAPRGARSREERYAGR